MNLQIEVVYDNQKCLKILPEHFSKICRLCLSKQGIIKLDDESVHGKKFIELLSALSLLDVDELDGLPQNICSACATQTIEYHYFKEKIYGTQAILNIVLGKKKPQDIRLSNTNSKNPEVQENTDNLDDDTNNITPQDEQMVESQSDGSDNEVDNDEYIKSESHSDDEQLEIDFNESIHNISHNEFVNEIEIKETHIPEDENSNTGTPTNNGVQKKYTCQFCGNVYNDKQIFLSHRHSEYRKRRSQVYDGAKEACKTCGKLIPIERMETHVNIHTKSKPHQCEICGKCFPNQTTLIAHKLSHDLAKKPYQCRLCGKCFNYPNSLDMHMRWHKKLDSHFCNACGLVFRSHAAFLQHESSHHNGEGEEVQYEENPTTEVPEESQIMSYPKTTKYCNICQRGFGSYVGLAVHMRSHTGEKPFRCKYCSKCFSQAGHLKAHVKLHTGEKAYTCMYCGKRFTLNGNLQQHIMTHTGNKPYTCDICKKGFYTNSSMRKHRKLHAKYVEEEAAE